MRCATKRFPPADAELARAAGIMEPGDADRITLLEIGHTGSESRDDAGALVSRDERDLWFRRPVPVRGMQIGVADAAGHHLDENFAASRRGDGDFLDRERPAEPPHHCCHHGLGHRILLDALNSALASATAAWAFRPRTSHESRRRQSPRPCRPGTGPAAPSSPREPAEGRGSRRKPAAP